ncbi:MAG: hypothetical protein JNL43_09895 [Flavobacteriales bacterium]|nr:hypothetical protein [Flavobacteriales bacterium]
MNTGLDRFIGRTLGVATIHGKERVIGPALADTLPIAGYVAIEDLDTDRFGAFSGEVKRTLDPLDACKAKAKHGAEVSGLDLVIASEGSFFPYPPAPFVPCDEEVLVLYDACDGSFFEHRHVSLQTVFGGEECTGWDQVSAFADRMKFPEHGLIVRRRETWNAGDTMKKGIRVEAELHEITTRLIQQNGSCWVETDMRAMMNPTRMEVIREAAERFSQELSTLCPACGACWFRITKAIPGLPCEQCGWPTASTRAYLRACHACGHTATGPRPDGRSTEEPQHCANCNP